MWSASQRSQLGSRRLSRHSCTWLLGKTKFYIFWNKGLLTQCRILSRTNPRTITLTAWKWKEVHVCKWSYGGGTCYIYLIMVHYNMTSTMAKECSRYHARPAELLATKKGEDCATTMSWIRTKNSFAIVRSALLCLGGSQKARKVNNLHNLGLDTELD